MKTKLNIKIDKLEQEYLEELRDRTGKDDEELVKLAIQALREKLCEPKPITPPYFPYPAYPVIPPNDDSTSIEPYKITWIPSSPITVEPQTVEPSPVKWVSPPPVTWVSPPPVTWTGFKQEEITRDSMTGNPGDIKITAGSITINGVQ